MNTNYIEALEKQRVLDAEEQKYKRNPTRKQRRMNIDKTSKKSYLIKQALK